MTNAIKTTVKAPTLDNRIVSWVLRSPLHGFLSGSVLLITYTGRKSQQLITVPVNYFHDGTNFYVISRRSRIWWRNLRGGAPVTIRWHGVDCSARGVVLESPDEVIESVKHLLRLPGYVAGMLHIKRDAAGNFNQDDIANTAKDTVIVRINLATR